MKKKNIEEILQKYEFRATDGRVNLIAALSKCRAPETIEKIAKMVSRSLDAANVYRALEAFEKAGIVRKTDFHDGKTYYELVLDRHHHHHIICVKCGKIEDVVACGPTLQKSVLAKSKSFSSIDSHSLEFFGVCKSCAS